MSPPLARLARRLARRSAANAAAPAVLPRALSHGSIRGARLLADLPKRPPVVAVAPTQAGATGAVGAAEAAPWPEGEPRPSRAEGWPAAGIHVGARHLMYNMGLPTDDHQAGWGGWTAHQAKNIRDSVERLSTAQRLSNRAAIGAVVILATGTGLVAWNWRSVRSQFSRESAEVVSLTIRDEQLQFTVSEISKALLHEILSDDVLAKTVALWVLRLLVSIQDEIGTLFVKILGLDRVVEAVNRLADKLVAYLCSSQTIQEQVGRLLVDAICLESSREASAKWAYDLVMRDDVTSGFRDLVVAALQTDAVVQQAQVLGSQIGDYILRDPAILLEMRRTLTETLKDDEVRVAAKESLWNVVLPWGGRKNQDKDKSRALKSLSDLAAIEELSQEERLMLRALQARLQNGGLNGANKAPVVADAEQTSRSSASSAFASRAVSVPVAPVAAAVLEPSDAVAAAPPNGARNAAVEAPPGATPEAPPDAPPLPPQPPPPALAQALSQAPPQPQPHPQALPEVQALLPPPFSPALPAASPPPPAPRKVATECQDGEGPTPPTPPETPALLEPLEPSEPPTPPAPHAAFVKSQSEELE